MQCVNGVSCRLLLLLLLNLLLILQTSLLTCCNFLFCHTFSRSHLCAAIFGAKLNSLGGSERVKLKLEWKKVFYHHHHHHREGIILSLSLCVSAITAVLCTLAANTRSSFALSLSFSLSHTHLFAAKKARHLDGLRSKNGEKVSLFF